MKCPRYERPTFKFDCRPVSSIDDSAGIDNTVSSDRTDGRTDRYYWPY